MGWVRGGHNEKKNKFALKCSTGKIKCYLLMENSINFFVFFETVPNRESQVVLVNQIPHSWLLPPRLPASQLLPFLYLVPAPVSSSKLEDINSSPHYCFLPQDDEW